MSRSVGIGTCSSLLEWRMSLSENRYPLFRNMRYLLADCAEAEALDQMLLDQDAEDHHRDGDDGADRRLRAVQTALRGALELVEQHGERRHLRVSQRQRQQEL